MKHEISLKDIFIRIPALGVVIWLVTMLGEGSWRTYGAQVLACLLFPAWLGAICLYVMERSLVALAGVVSLGLIGLII